LLKRRIQYQCVEVAAASGAHGKQGYCEPVNPPRIRRLLQRNLLLPDIVSRSLLSLRGDAGANDPVFASRKGGHLTERAVNGMVKRTTRKAGINEAISLHWLRHAHGSHAIDRGASLPEGAIDAGPRQHRHRTRLSARAAQHVEGLHLDPGVFLR
jgi:integrase/recombinase XerD